MKEMVNRRGMRYGRKKKSKGVGGENGNGIIESDEVGDRLKNGVGYKF